MNHSVQRVFAKQGSLFQQIRLARLWLPLVIVGVVLFHQLLIVPLGGASWEFWSQLLFYSILGPVVTYLTLNWIASEVRQREEAQNELRRLYSELQKSHELLGAIQHVTEQFATSADLESVLAAASRGITEVTGARGAAIILGASSFGVTRSFGLSADQLRDAAHRDRALSRGEPLSGRGLDDAESWVLSSPLVWAGKLEGSVHAYYDAPVSADRRESFSILSSEFSAAAEANRSRTRDLLTLIEVDRSIRAEGNLERLLEALLSRTMTRAGASWGGVYMADEAHLLQLRAHRGLSGQLPVTTVRIGEGFVGRAASGAEPCIARELSDEERSNPLLAGAGSAVSLPLVAESELLGIIILAHPDATHFDEADLPFLSLLAGQVSLAVRNARAYLQSEELAIAAERARIAREIHDGVAQSLAFTGLKLDLVQRLMGAQPKKAAFELEEAKKTIRETIKEVRRSIFALRPVDLERHGFLETLRRYCRDYGQQNDIRVSLAVEEAPLLSVKSEAVLFRIFQEAMNNVAKHAGASEVRVRVGKTEEGQAFVAVEDNGKGFDPGVVSDRVTSAGGLGLRQMRERMEGRRGRFELISAPGQGTRLFASVPE